MLSNHVSGYAEKPFTKIWVIFPWWPLHDLMRFWFAKLMLLYEMVYKCDSIKRLFPHSGSHSSSKDYCCLLPLISQNDNDCGIFPPITSANRDSIHEAKEGSYPWTNKHEIVYILYNFMKAFSPLWQPLLK